MFKCIISHSSTKSLVPPLHEFIIRKLDFFPLFFGKLNSLNIAVYLLTCQYFGRAEKKLSRRKVGFFCRLFIVQVKKICYEKKVQGELLGSSFHYSSLANRRVARKKRGDGKDEPFLISVVPGISVVAGKMSHSLLAWCLE